jgi:hypothetical protein
MLQPLQQRLARARASSSADAQRAQRLGHHVERRHTRHHAQELADIAQGLAAQRQDLARRGLVTSSAPIRICPACTR